MMSKRVLVAGGGGYIGTVLCEELLKKGHEVLCLDRFFFGRHLMDEFKDNKRFIFCQSDIRFADPSLFRGTDTVIDLAGISNDPSCDLDPDLTRDINLEGCRHLVRLAKAAGVQRYIYSSSCSIYGAGSNRELTEESPLNPVSLYARIKREAEDLILEEQDTDFCVTILRNATVYGLSRRMRLDLLVNIMTAHAVSRGKIFVLGGGKQWRPNVHVRDVCKAFQMVMEADSDVVSGEIFNVGANEQNFQVLQVANMIREVVPYVEVEVVPDDVDKRDYNVNFDKISDRMGYRVERSILEGAVEVKQAIERGVIDVDDIRMMTLKYYRFLIEAEKTLEEVRLNGKVF